MRRLRSGDSYSEHRRELHRQHLVINPRWYHVATTIELLRTAAFGVVAMAIGVYVGAQSAGGAPLGFGLPGGGQYELIDWLFIVPSSLMAAGMALLALVGAFGWISAAIDASVERWNAEHARRQRHGQVDQ